MENKKKKRVGLLKNELTTPKKVFDITKTEIEPVKLNLEQLRIKDSENKIKKYKMVRCPEELKNSIDDLQKVLNDKFIYDTIDKMYNHYIATALNEEKRRSLRVLKQMRD